VLEHDPDPNSTLQECRRLLRSNGTLTIAVPNDVLAWSSMRNRLGRILGLKAYRQFSPKLGILKAGLSTEIHLSHFTPDVLKRLLRNHGFSVVDESIDPYYASQGVKRVLHNLRYLLHGALFACCRINRYSTIWVMSRKAPD
jgi:SAM-dependent methyltransferase